VARLQILQLPEGAGDDRPPYLLIVDELPTGDEQLDMLRRDLADNDITARVGARGALCFEGTVTVPANDVPPLSLLSAETDDEPDVDYTEMIETVDRVLGINSGRGKPDVAGWLLTACRELEKSEAAREHLRKDRDDARMWARHGYEIGQRHCSWTDHGVAPDWLTEGWPNHFDSCEHLKRAAEYDTAICRALEVVDELETADVHGSAWDANQEAARRIREVLRPSSPGNEPTVKP
jgi:hypothetical protein